MDHGSRKPLNWKGQQYAEPVKKAVSHAEKLDVHSRAGTPPTRRGSFNGAPSGLTPARPPELNPALVLNKAVRTPVKTDADGKQQFARKRGADGKFVEAEDTGTESTAQDDSAKQERSNKLQQHKMNDKLVDAKVRARAVSRGESVKNPSVKDNHEKDGKVDKALGGQQVPGMPSALPMDNVNDPVSKQIGVTGTGAPIYDDPHHSEHADFSPQDHQDAVQANQTAAQAALTQGDSAGAMRLSNNATTHQSLGQDSSNPSARFMEQLNTPNGMAPMMDDLPQDDLSTLMGGATPSVPQKPPSSMGGPMDSAMPMPGQPQPALGGGAPPPAPAAGAMMPASQEPDMGAPAMPPPPMPQDPMGAAPTAAPAGTPPSPAPVQDDLSTFIDPAGDQNKPAASPPMPGPAPGMLNSQTGTGVGPQTSVPQHAGTAPTPLMGGAAQSPVPPTGDMFAPEPDPMGGDPMGGDPMGGDPMGGDPMGDGGALDLDWLYGDGEDSDMQDGGEAPPFGEDSSDDSGDFGSSSEDDTPDDDSGDFGASDEGDEEPEDKKKLDDAIDKALRKLASLI